MMGKWEEMGKGGMSNTQLLWCLLEMPNLGSSVCLSLKPVIRVMNNESMLKIGVSSSEGTEMHWTLKEVLCGSGHMGIVNGPLMTGPPESP